MKNNKRIRIDKAYRFDPDIDLSEKFVYEGNLKLRYIYFDFSLDVDLLVKGSLELNSISFLSSISEKIFVESCIIIKNCPLLKTIPIQVTSGKDLHLENKQHLITILSKEQFLSLRTLIIYNEITNKSYVVKTYEEYYSLVEDIILKRKLLNATIF